MMITYEYEGFVNKIRKTSWGAEIILRTENDETQTKYPQHILINVSQKNVDKLPADLDANDKVYVKFMPFLKEGVSERTQKAYTINNNMMMEMKILEKAQPSQDEAADSTPDDMPF